MKMYKEPFRFLPEIFPARPDEDFDLLVGNSSSVSQKNRTVDKLTVFCEDAAELIKSKRGTYLVSRLYPKSSKTLY